MRRSPKKLSFLVSTDFNLSHLSKLNIDYKVMYGGWVKRRIPYTADEMVHVINSQRINILVVEVEEVPRIVFERCPDLKAVFSMRSNPVNVDLEAAKKKGVIVFHPPGRNAHAVAELTICLMLDLLRSVSKSYLEMREGKWGAGKQDPYLRFRGSELQSKTVGLVGLGAIGQSVVKLIKGFSPEVLAFDPYQDESVYSDLGVRSVGLRTLLETADIVSVHVSLNKETKGLLGEHELSLVKPGALIINTARAEVIEKKALLDALYNGRLAGVALDVHYAEPPSVEDPLYSFDNVLYTPHIGGATYEVIQRGSEMVIMDLVRYLKGEAPKFAAVLPECPRLVAREQ